MMETRQSIFIASFLAPHLDLAYSMIIPWPRDDVLDVDQIKRGHLAAASLFIARDSAKSQFFHYTVVKE